MEYVRLGTSGMKVSRLCLGCMTYGDPAWRPWVATERDALPFIRAALDAGVTFFDTADIYSNGESERILGRALCDFATRDDVVIATKAFFPMRDAPNARGLSRKHLFSSIDASLQRLGTDYVDLYIVHRFDPDTPIEETLDALDAIVRSGKVRYLGASSMHAWQFMKMLDYQRHHRLAPFVSMQSQYSLICRDDERDMLPLCIGEGIAYTPWSPLGRGLLAGSRNAATTRAATDQQIASWYDGRDAVAATVETVGQVAQARGVPPAQIALAWALRRPGVTAPIVGLSKPHHVTDALAALGLTLDDDETALVEAAFDRTVEPVQW
ncbi:aldo/keto reductase [Burkholderia sp. IDO3]|uniref:aldo/keto reductase n=1 Tax=Burkholderia sp. IDO3 TaxID=1705310 RepID=UPI000BBA7D08|nr:aldo/keto reductase [Burkholderia sp. IDO3]AXK62000.1 aldo/keto reductase [Burkholderia sp. IDO3]PCD61206.1 aldo/keto reductase [Burkholderia sp. IDO3]